MSNDKLIRDALGSPVPQYYNLDLQYFAVETTDGSVVTDIDFSKTRLIRDALGSPIPQLWDSVQGKWVEKTTQNGSSVGNYLSLTGGDMEGILTAFPNTNNTLPQVRNITLRTTEPTVDEMVEGEICLIMEV